MQHRPGFTLLEMAIVIMIIALIIGGITLAQDMIRRAQIQTAIGESQRYIQVIHDFHDKYSALPGDFGGASTLWTNLCNYVDDGDGNGKITTIDDDTTYFEQFIAWNHLACATMVEGRFTGASGPGITLQNRLPGVNVPISQLKGAGWGLLTVPVIDIKSYNNSATVEAFTFYPTDTAPNTILWLGGVSSSGIDPFLPVGVLTIEEASLIDDKIDDGVPVTGKIIVPIEAYSASPACADDDDTTYDFTRSSDKICSLVFKTGL